MKKKLQELQKLRGVGEVLSRRLVEAGLDTFAKVAAAGEEGLKGIAGINPRAVPAIVEQAKGLAGEVKSTKAQKREEVERLAASLKGQVQGVALRLHETFRDELAGKSGKKAERAILKLMATVEKVERKAGKGARKRLQKAEKGLSRIADAGLTGIRKGLKKARKTLRKVAGR